MSFRAYFYLILALMYTGIAFAPRGGGGRGGRAYHGGGRGYRGGGRGYYGRGYGYRGGWGGYYGGLGLGLGLGYGAGQPYYATYSDYSTVPYSCYQQCYDDCRNNGLGVAECEDICQNKCS